MQKYYRNAFIKCQIFFLNLNMPKTKWEGAEDAKINNFLSTEVDKNTYMSLVGISSGCPVGLWTRMLAW